MLKLDEFNRILTVHYSYTSLFSCDECVRRSLVQYVIELFQFQYEEAIPYVTWQPLC